jgi:hypothetical protein
MRKWGGQVAMLLSADPWSLSMWIGLSIRLYLDGGLNKIKICIHI